MPADFCLALAEDLAQLARLHEREVDAATLAALQAVGFPGNLALVPETVAVETLSAALAVPPGLDDLAVDFAALYLTGARGCSPLESVWLGEERLAAGPPLHAWRALLAEVGLALAGRRQPYEDHLACQLAWLGRALVLPGFSPERLARVLDEHCLRWLPEWAGRVGERAETPFYQGLAALTLAWLEALRQLLAEVCGLTIPSSRDHQTVAVPGPGERVMQPLTFMPGKGPGW